MGFDFIAIDFETANANYNSACSMGIVVVANNEIVDTFYTLIQPPTLDFDDINISVHGINPKDVTTAPKFNEVWDKIKHYFDGNYLITAYNAPFDMAVLKMCLNEYDIAYPEFKYFCSLQLSKKLYTCANHKLDTICKLLNIILEDHHNSLADSSACAKIVMKTSQNTNSLLPNLTFKNFSSVKESQGIYGKGSKFKSKFSSISINDIKPMNENIDSSHIFYNKHFVFTGNLQTIDRKNAMQKVVDVGGVLKNGVSKAVNYIVVGIQDKKIIGSDGLSSKERKALELIEAGHDIKILTEEEFLRHLA